MIVVVCCGARKRQGRHPAYELYTGPYFVKSMDWARSVVSLSNIFILSARYGLIKSTQQIDSYNLKLGQPNSVDEAIVNRQADELGIRHETDVIVVGGENYLSLARSVWAHARAPFGKNGGLLPDARYGYQQRLLTKYKGIIP